jgi:hypothetical protein
MMIFHPSISTFTDLDSILFICLKSFFIFFKLIFFL